MKEPVLKISPKKYSGETTIISMRISKELVKKLDSIASQTGLNRNELLTMSLEFAVDHMEIETNDNKEAKE